MKKKTKKFDPIKLEIYKNSFFSVAEEMGAALQRTSFSPNIKERVDFSCAVFDGAGKMIAQGEHMPVHLGSMPLSVESAIKNVTMNRGDTVILNDPYNGGTHLPDITLVRPVFLAKERTPSFYTANRAHHSDIGGMTPGSMPLSREIYQEGFIIPPVKFEENFKIDRSFMKVLLANVRTPEEREGDLLAQYMAARVGEMRLLDIVKENGKAEVFRYMEELQDYSERMVRALIKGIPNGTYSFTDYMDDDGFSENPVKIAVTITIKGTNAVIDFSESGPQTLGPINAVYAITLSAVFYVFRTLVNYSIPSNYGCMVPLKVIAPEGLIVNAVRPAAVAGGNVETSQRIVDVLYGALSRAMPDRIPAASGGTMNNMTFGGIHPDTGEPFAYYETVACGMGARPDRDGIDGIHTHMTNSMNSPVEVLENQLPVRLKKYGFRRGSGGKGKFKGGDGTEKSFEFLTESNLCLLSDRRKHAPYGLHGGSSGKTGENFIIKNGKKIKLPSKFNISVKKGDVFTLRTPGGGGYGPA
ncbi:hydantoinase B/oxoprolinase family protein [candidate division KSB1 bacterium]|nr:hydantoinase B/oxoprolinase family protein [candidate division KSB1 bacterium]